MIFYLFLPGKKGHYLTLSEKCKIIIKTIFHNLIALNKNKKTQNCKFKIFFLPIYLKPYTKKKVKILKISFLNVTFKKTFFFCIKSFFISFSWTHYFKIKIDF